jgi:hypothetical protein
MLIRIHAINPGSIAALLLIVFTPTRAISDIAGRGSPAAPPKYYQQPTGFAGHEWGDPLSSFDRFKGEPKEMDASWYDGDRVDLDFRCMQVGNNACDLHSTVRWTNQMKPRSVYTLVAQYQIEGQGFRIEGVTLHPVTHFFCAQFNEFLQKPPAHVAERMRYCGIRLDFESENGQALAQLPPDHVTQYQRLLRYLLLNHGKPHDYRGHVSISDGETAPSARRDFPRRYRWCTELDSIFAPKCDVKMTLTFDVETGRGSLLMAADELVRFALAQQGDAPGKRGPLHHELIRDPFVLYQ